MKELGFYIRLLLIFSIFFLYKFIMGFVYNNQFEIIFWGIILGVYVSSLLVLSFVVNKYQKK